MGAPNLPIAYLLTWTCYGTWLHGDERGSVDLDHNTPGTPFLPPDEPRRVKEYCELKHQPVLMDVAARHVIDETIKRHATIRSWNLLAVNVRTNHVHVVISVGEVLAREVLRQFKYWTTRRLKDLGHFDKDIGVWTNHGSTRFLWSEESVVQAINYVNEYQGAGSR